jgi:molybdate transport system ATP-binding protein
MIELDISKQVKSYQGFIDLKVKTTFESESISRISGPSGVGKTTLLKIIAGLITPEKGTIRVDGALWFDADSKFTKKTQDRNVGFVFQDYALFPNMTVEQQLRYGATDEAYIEHLLSIGQMEAFRKNLPKQLSGGQQQRLAILRALSTKPKLLLMDEPFSALDQVLKSQLILNLKALFTEQKTTVLLVTHAQDEIKESSIFSL